MNLAPSRIAGRGVRRWEFPFAAVLGDEPFHGKFLIPNYLNVLCFLHECPPPLTGIDNNRLQGK